VVANKVFEFINGKMVSRDLTPEEIAEMESANRRYRLEEKSRPLTEAEVSAMFITQQINTLVVDDNTALRMKSFYPTFESIVGQTVKNGFKFTDRAIRVTGTMEFGDFEDSFGYKYYYRISDATYEVLDITEMSDELKLWQSLASSDVIGEIYRMLDYVDFLCRWPVYTLKVNGLHTYARPDQALSRIETEGSQYNYGFREGYFDDLIASVRAVDGTAFSDVVEMIESARALCEKAYKELKDGQYTIVKEYSNEFGDGRDQYRLYKINELTSEASAIYQAFATWIAKWEI
jgi:hypothetical protein